jgi:hypothetical protein
MGWTFRKSASFGPFRLNFSKSGISASFGVKGARISVSKRGTYVNLGANGIYYRQRIDNVKSQFNAKPRFNNHITPSRVTQGREQNSLGEISHSIGTRNVEQVTDVDSRKFIEQLESAANRRPLFKWLGLWPSIILFLYALSFANDVVLEGSLYKHVFTVNKEVVHVRAQPSVTSHLMHVAKEGDRFVIVATDPSEWISVYLSGDDGNVGFVRADLGNVSRVEAKHTRTTRLQQYPGLVYGYLILAILLIVWCFYLTMLDRRRRAVEITYTLDGEISKLHNKFPEYFREFASSNKVWQKLQETGVDNAKYHAGASQLISRVPVHGIYFDLSPLKFLKTNVQVPSIHLKGTELYFFPERLIVKRGKIFGAVFYKSMSITSDTVNFIESETLATDVVVVDHTWQYLNKQGGPDRRFNGNRQLPICRYQSIRLSPKVDFWKW